MHQNDGNNIGTYDSTVRAAGCVGDSRGLKAMERTYVRTHHTSSSSEGKYNERSISGNDNSYSSINNISEKKRNSKKNKINHNTDHANDNDDGNGNGIDSYTNIEGIDMERERERERDKERENQKKCLRIKSSREGSTAKEKRGSVRGRAGRFVRTLNDPTRRSLFVGAGLGLRKEEY